MMVYQLSAFDSDVLSPNTIDLSGTNWGHGIIFGRQFPLIVTPVSSTDWVVYTQLCKLRGTSDAHIFYLVQV